MYDLESNFDKIPSIVNITLTYQLAESENLQYHYYPDPLKLSDAEIMALVLTLEAMTIGSENWFWSKPRTDCLGTFGELQGLTLYNALRMSLSGWFESLSKSLGATYTSINQVKYAWAA